MFFLTTPAWNQHTMPALTLHELLPAVAALSEADKRTLVHWISIQIEDVEPQEPPKTEAPFNPRVFFGVASESRERIDAQLEVVREGWKE